MKVGSRESELAMKQTEIFLECLGRSDPSVRTEIIPIKSSGDIDLKTSLDKLQGFGAFVRELDAALLEGRIDVAVNSMKDMPVDVPEGLCVPAVLKRADIRDVIMPCSLDGLKQGSVKTIWVITWAPASALRRDTSSVRRIMSSLRNAADVMVTNRT